MPAVNMVETWCGRAFQDRVGLLPGQAIELYQQGVSSDHADTYVCSTCRKMLQIDTEYPGRLADLAAMDNDALYQEFRDAHESDDWDGAFTTAGTLRLQMAVAEMERRLRECGFLSGEGQQ